MYCLPFLLAGADFSPFGSSNVTFSVGGPRIECFDFNITDDAELEGDHVFTVDIIAISSMPPHAMIGTPSKTLVTITENEGKLYTQMLSHKPMGY